MKHTTNYDFNIPEDSDQYSRDHYNENFEKIDEKTQEFIDIIETNGGEIE